MNLDDPLKPKFASCSSYRRFAARVRHQRRFVWEHADKAFLDTVLGTLRDRDVNISQGTVFYRAQRGIEYHPLVDEAGNEICDGDGNKIEADPRAFGGKRMKPLEHSAQEGRINPKGIPVLYLATTPQTAISEVRPWIGSQISLARFKIVRSLKAINLSLGYGQMSIGHLKLAEFCGEEKVSPEATERAVWIDIDNAFSYPATRSDDVAEYVPTQILAEVFRDAGYDAVIYRSQFGDEGYNVAFFHIGDAEPVYGVPYRVTGIEVKFEQIGNPWGSKGSK